MLDLVCLGLPGDTVFKGALDAFFEGDFDEKTSVLCGAEKKAAPSGAAGWLSCLKGSADR